MRLNCEDQKNWASGSGIFGVFRPEKASKGLFHLVVVFRILIPNMILRFTFLSVLFASLSLCLAQTQNAAEPTEQAKPAQSPDSHFGST